MFKRLHLPEGLITIHIDGRPVTAAVGDSVAAALLAESSQPFRTTPISGAPRLPYCMIGNCFECLVEIDGVANCQACLVPVREGMQVRRQEGPVWVEL